MPKQLIEILEAHHVWLTLENRLQCKACGLIEGDQLTSSEKRYELKLAHVAEVLDKHMQKREQKMRQLIRDMTDPGKCWFDHHGGCQEHGYLDLKPGELCPHAEAKQLLGDEPNGR